MGRGRPEDVRGGPGELGASPWSWQEVRVQGRRTEVGINVDIQTAEHTGEVLCYILGQTYHIKKWPNTGVF